MSDQPPSDTVIPFPKRQPYEAFTRSPGPLPRLALRSGEQLRSVPYFAVHDVTFNVHTGNLFLSTTDLNASVYGRDLHQILESLNLHECSLIQEYAAEAFILPEPDGPPKAFVERIVFEELRPIRIVAPQKYR